MKILNGECPQSLTENVSFHLDMTSIVGTEQKYRGQFEERLKVILEELQNADDIIIFIDGIHTIIGVGNTSGSLDFPIFLNQLLARGELQCIGFKPPWMNIENIEKDGALGEKISKNNG